MVYHGAKARLDPNTFFYTEVFTVMIFTDVLIVILSLSVSDRYELVFRNAAFVISTIMIRFSLTVGRPSGALLALSGMAFGILHALVGVQLPRSQFSRPRMNRDRIASRCFAPISHAHSHSAATILFANPA